MSRQLPIFGRLAANCAALGLGRLKHCVPWRTHDAPYFRSPDGSGWRDRFPRLADRYRVIAPDLPGFRVHGMEIQLGLFPDHANNVKLYPASQEYFRKFQPPLLAIWGEYDPFSIPPGAEAIRAASVSESDSQGDYDENCS